MKVWFRICFERECNSLEEAEEFLDNTTDNLWESDTMSNLSQECEETKMKTEKEKSIIAKVQEIVKRYCNVKNPRLISTQITKSQYLNMLEEISALGKEQSSGDKK